MPSFLELYSGDTPTQNVTAGMTGTAANRAAIEGGGNTPLGGSGEEGGGFDWMQWILGLLSPEALAGYRQSQAQGQQNAMTERQMAEDRRRYDLNRTDRLALEAQKHGINMEDLGLRQADAERDKKADDVALQTAQMDLKNKPRLLKLGIRKEEAGIEASNAATAASEQSTANLIAESERAPERFEMEKRRSAAAIAANQSTIDLNASREEREKAAANLRNELKEIEIQEANLRLTGKDPASLNLAEQKRERKIGLVSGLLEKVFEEPAQIASMLSQASVRANAAAAEMGINVPSGFIGPVSKLDKDYRELLFNTLKSQMNHPYGEGLSDADKMGIMEAYAGRLNIQVDEKGNIAPAGDDGIETQNTAAIEAAAKADALRVYGTDDKTVVDAAKAQVQKRGIRVGQHIPMLGGTIEDIEGITGKSMSEMTSTLSLYSVPLNKTQQEQHTKYTKKAFEYLEKLKDTPERLLAGLAANAKIMNRRGELSDDDYKSGAYLKDAKKLNDVWGYMIGSEAMSEYANAFEFGTDHSFGPPRAVDPTRRKEHEKALGKEGWGFGHLFGASGY